MVIPVRCSKMGSYVRRLDSLFCAIHQRDCHYLGIEDKLYQMHNTIKVEIVPGTPDVESKQNICASVRHGGHPFVEAYL